MKLKNTIKREKILLGTALALIMISLIVSSVFASDPLTITEMKPDKTEVVAGETVKITVTVKNNLDSKQTFNIDIDGAIGAGTVNIGEIEDCTLEKGQTKTFTYSWTAALFFVNPSVYTLHAQCRQDSTSVSNFYIDDDVTVRGRNQSTIGGFSVLVAHAPVDKFGLFASYTGLTSAVLVATVVTAIYSKHVKRRKERQ